MKYILSVSVNFDHTISFTMLIRLNIASQLPDALNSVLDAYQQLGEQVPSLANSQQLFISVPHMRNVLIMMCRDILRFHQDSVIQFKHRRKSL